MNLSRKSQKWVDADLISGDQRARILDHEKSHSGSRFKSGLGYVGMFSILLGFSLMVASNWQGIPASVKLGGHFLLNTVLAYLVWIWRNNPDRTIHREGALFSLWGLTMTLIAMIGQIYQLSGETYEAVRLWFWITTPMLVYFAQGRYLTTLWAVFFVFYVPFDLFFSVIDDIESPSRQLLASLIVMIAMPILLWFAGAWPLLERTRPALASSLRRLGGGLALLCASIASGWFYINWISEASFPHMIDPVFVVGVAVMTCVGLVGARSLPHWQPEQRFMIDLLLLCSVFTCLPFVLQLPYSFLGMIHFIALWVIAGVLFQRAGYDRWVNLAITLITLRLFFGFLELFGSMMVSGLGFIIVGIVLMGLVYAARHIKRMVGGAA